MTITNSQLITALRRIYPWSPAGQTPDGAWAYRDVARLADDILAMYGFMISESCSIVPRKNRINRITKQCTENWVRRYLVYARA